MKASVVSTGVNFADAEQLDAFEANTLNSLVTNERGIWNVLCLLILRQRDTDQASEVHLNDFNLNGTETEALSKEESVGMVIDTADATGKITSSVALVARAGAVLLVCWCWCCGIGCLRRHFQPQQATQPRLPS
jgi:hypothetical protein